jgi:hypothetical protein
MGKAIRAGCGQIVQMHAVAMSTVAMNTVKICIQRIHAVRAVCAVRMHAIRLARIVRFYLVTRLPAFLYLAAYYLFALHLAFLAHLSPFWPADAA